ncbi:MAG: aminotransferase class I/II-fold pyridoxal phosphate-dependent enzyme [Anaerolineaceae bacterium]|nr:aminotransferase class I/II-fold pyridoxal phosphate-dependent enzyme [Anaerolineaceae bacterium]
MGKSIQTQGLNTLLTHYKEFENSQNSHITPIFQSSAFIFPDVKTGSDIFAGENDGFCYSRVDNPNTRQLAQKIAALEGIDLIRANPDKPIDDLVAGRVYGSGMAAISTGVFACLKAGSTVITQKTLYGNSYNLMAKILPEYGFNVVWVDGDDLNQWEKAFKENPEAVLAFIETPANPTVEMVDIEQVSTMAHKNNTRVLVDNTFATPYCQLPLNLGVDFVAHSTTKYLSGHGQIIGGALISNDPDFFDPKKEKLFVLSKVFGGAASPFDAWLTNIGLKTFQLRMKQHVENAMQAASWLEMHPQVSKVYYPGLTSHSGHETANKQMQNGFGAMISFELKGGFDAGVSLMQELKLINLAVSLGNVDSLIQHPASMTHAAIPPEERLKFGINDSLIRFSVGIEDVEDILDDLDQGLEIC